MNKNIKKTEQVEKLDIIEGGPEIFKVIIENVKKINK